MIPRRGFVDRLAMRTRRRNSLRATPLWYAYEVALGWLRDNHLAGAGIAYSNVRQTAYPEVTGYLIPTLLEAGEREGALRLARWLLGIQRPDGAFEDTDREPYLFDTGQVLRGLVAVVDEVPEAEPAIRKAADWMLSCRDSRGAIRPGPAWMARFGAIAGENIHLYALPPLREAGQRLGEQRYVDAVESSVQFYVNRTDLLEFQTVTHFYGYVLEALADLGQPDLARVGLQTIVDMQAADGSIPALPGARWVCSPGVAQMAVVGYKTGVVAFADAALDYLQSVQMPSGGFLGSYGPGADYIPLEELSWACKYFLDACQWRIVASFGQDLERFPAEIDPSDDRVAAVVGALGNADGKRILDVGCGKGRFLRRMQHHYPRADLWGVDISDALLAFVPAEVSTRRGSMLNIPRPDSSFDAVVCVEALEHSVRIEPAVREMCRVLKPGGKLIVIDKDVRYLGVVPIDRWEKWFDPGLLASLLNRYCDDVSFRPLNVPVGDERHSCLVAWQGVRHASPLADDTEALSPSPLASVDKGVGRLRHYHAARRRAEALVLVAQGFRQFEAGDLVGARRAFVDALRRDIRWIRNRGVVSIVLKSLPPR
jgi:malonyl-CoA O-methyltransferase